MECTSIALQIDPVEIARRLTSITISLNDFG